MSDGTITGAAPPEQLLRLGTHAEKDYFAVGGNLFDVVVFNANLVEYSAGAIASFVIGTLPGKPFFIDPITHAFGHSPRHIMRWKEEDGERSLVVKRSIERLARRYGTVIERRVESTRAVTPGDLAQPSEREELCNNVIEFQIRRLYEGLEDDRKYLGDQEIRPSLVIAPYFYMNVTSFEDWLPINCSLVSIATRSHQEVPVFAEIVLDRQILEDDESIGRIVREYGALECDGFLIWISDFSEHGASRLALRGFRNLVRMLGGGERPVYNLYGGYFSALLYFDGLTGFCHGPGYGEMRNVVPVGGGIPRPKYYFTPLHNRFLHREIELLLAQEGWTAEQFLREVCDCSICRLVIDENIDNFRIFGETEVRLRDDGTSYHIPTARAARNSTLHYMHAKRREVENVRNASDRSALIADLVATYRRFEPSFGPAEAGHLVTWARALG